MVTYPSLGPFRRAERAGTGLGQEPRLLVGWELQSDVLPNNPMNMLPFTKALRLPNNDFTVTDGACGTRARNRSRSSSVAVSTFAAVFVDVDVRVLGVRAGSAASAGFRRPCSVG
jgi:hypothetical protein